MLCGTYSAISLQRSERRKAKGKLTMRSLLILIAICFSATALAQSAPPKAGNTGSGKAESAYGLQIRWNGPGHKAVGW
jgi:hypothetical protein